MTRDAFPADLDVLTGLVHEAFPRAGSVSIERASGGHVVVVYRATVDGVRYYLRLAEEPGEDLTTDALVLERLRTLDVCVPGVVAASPSTTTFPRSWMIMAEVPGRSIAQGGTDDEARQAATAAGRDVAVINSVPVAGFGWLQRDGSEQLTAELPSYSEFAGSYLPNPWPGRLSELFGQRQLDVLHALVAGEQDRPLRGGHLVHGDLDVTHIYSDGGRYSGIIGPLADGYREAIRRSAILLGLRQLSRWLSPERGYSLSKLLVQLRVAELSNLIDGKPAHQER